ncbi:hypothetical protein, partial [Clostridium perfringens]
MRKLVHGRRNVSSRRPFRKRGCISAAMVRTVVKTIRFGTNGLFDPRLRRNLNPIVTFETRDDPRDKEDFIMNKAIIA